MPEDRVMQLYNQGFVFHDDEKTIELKVGDGLDEFSVEQLNVLVDNINVKVKKYAQNQKEYQIKKCKKSKIKSKQMGLIRSWRRQYGEIETTG